jgi:hypothetical protein
MEARTLRASSSSRRRRGEGAEALDLGFLTASWGLMESLAKA